ncbi:DUF1501 domain-containing protein [Puniceicoccaceae bacterium K14]|nr:DUF1501 domain-containing protein [Puniceicoccaceae bacterium K14]
MKSNFSRREFVKKSAWGAASTITLPAFLQNTIFNLDARASTLPSPGKDGPIFVIVELAGGNDSLNTVIPYQNSTYLDARPNIAIRGEDGLHSVGSTNSVTGQSEALGLHPNLTQLHTLWEDGDLAIINGVGYPNPNLSHFTSFDYWHSATPNEISNDGWIGRYFNSQCSGCDATQGIEISNRKSNSFKVSDGISPSINFDDIDQYGWKDLELRGRDIPLEELYRKLIGLDHIVDQGIDTTNDALSYVQRASHNAMISARNVFDASERGGELAFEEWASSGLANDLKKITKLIKGGMDTSIYYAHQSGFDTHNNQANGGSGASGSHADLLDTVDKALGSFVAEMKLAGLWDRVVILTYSEFGRKVIENGSQGTDHGAAESVFVLGGQVSGNQFYGSFPDLAEDARVKRHSLDYNVDFRTVYRSILENWMHVPSNQIADIFPSQPANFNPLSFV